MKTSEGNLGDDIEDTISCGRNDWIFITGYVIHTHQNIFDELRSPASGHKAVISVFLVYDY